MGSRVLKTVQDAGKQFCFREHIIQSTLLVLIVKIKSTHELEDNMSGLNHWFSQDYFNILNFWKKKEKKFSENIQENWTNNKEGKIFTPCELKWACAVWASSAVRSIDGEIEQRPRKGEKEMLSEGLMKI